MFQLNVLPEGPKAADNGLTYYAGVHPQNLVTWAASAMKNSYSPYSGCKEGVLLRTERGDISVGTNVETINWDGLTAIEVAIGRLFAQQPWVDRKNMPERISDVIYALEDLDPANPDSFVPSGRSLDWLRKFGSPDTVLHFATPEKGILASKRLHEILPHGPRMKALQEYLEKTYSFSSFLRQNQNRPPEVDNHTWHSLRRSRLHAFSPYSAYRVSVVIEADALPVEEERRASLIAGFNEAGLDEDKQQALLKYIFNDLSRFAGINVELSGNEALHAEGCAIGAMITDLGPAAKLHRVYLQGGFRDGADDCTCCGKCRQLVNEFSTAATEVVTVAEDKIMPAMKRDQLLPGTFAKLG